MEIRQTDVVAEKCAFPLAPFITVDTTCYLTSAIGISFGAHSRFNGFVVFPLFVPLP